MGGSAVLSKLAAKAPTAVPDQAGRLPDSEAQTRRELALAIGDSMSGWWLLAGVLDFFAVLMLILTVKGNHAPMTADEKTGFGILLFAALVFTVLAMVASHGKRVENARTFAEGMKWPERQPFPITGYPSWLACDRPLLDLRLRASFDRVLFIDAVAAIDPAIDVEVIDDHTVRLAIPARSFSQDTGTLRFGDVPLLHHVFSELVLPLHHDIGSSTSRWAAC
jgi:hypothetical protein